MGGSAVILCAPSGIEPEVLECLTEAGYRLELTDDPAQALDAEPTIAAAVVSLAAEPVRAAELLKVLRTHREEPLAILVLVTSAQLAELKMDGQYFDDFCLVPAAGVELVARIDQLTHALGAGTDTVVVGFGPIKINLETYQAAVDGRILDLTYMEYELLKFLTSNPTKVFTREALLSRVWGYEYYGGARTVDVHIRRLRAKLGEEHASLIETVRSVGYRLGQPTWGR